MAVTGVVLVKSMEYRNDALEEFSNRYHFKGNPPSDPASWNQLITDVANIERLIYPPSVKYVRAYGYNSEDPGAPNVHSVEWPAGSQTPGGGSATGNAFAGDQAACIEWKLDIKNARGKWRYLRKYQHVGFTDPADSDSLSSSYKAELETYAAAMQTHYGGMTAQQHPSLSVTEHTVIPWVTTRTLKRRGKRPKVA